MKLYRGTQGPVNMMVANADSALLFATTFFGQSTSHEPLIIEENGRRVAIALIVDGEIRLWDGREVQYAPIPQYQGG